MEIRVLGAHNLETAITRLVSLLIDEVLLIDAGALTSTLSFSEQENIKTIILTHHHYDHIRDIPIFALGNAQHTANIYAPAVTLEAFSSYLLDGTLYPDFRIRPTVEKPALKLFALEPYKEEVIDDYRVLGVPVNHTIPTVGYCITSPQGSSVFYTSDTGLGLSPCWDYISPQLLITELTLSNRLERVAIAAGHLCPRFLREELKGFRQSKGYLPPVVLVHMNPKLEAEIKEEVAQVAKELGAEITFAYEGMRITI